MHLQNRAHFFAISAQLMRRILVDHARSHQYAKRGGGAHTVSLDEATVMAHEQGALELATIDERKSRIVELRFSGGSSSMACCPRARASSLRPNRISTRTSGFEMAAKALTQYRLAKLNEKIAHGGYESQTRRRTIDLLVGEQLVTIGVAQIRLLFDCERESLRQSFAVWT
jgi:hypothetical protein